MYRPKPSRTIAVRLLVCLLLISLLSFAFSISFVVATPKGKAHGFGKANGNAYGHGGFSPVGGGVNPAGIITGSGGLKVGGAQGASSFSPGNHTGPTGGGKGPTGAGFAPATPQTGNKGSTVLDNIGDIFELGADMLKVAGNKIFFGQSQSKVFIKVNPQSQGLPAGTAVIKTQGNKPVILGSGDVFLQAIWGSESLPEPLTVPDPIGAKGPNPTHGGTHPKKGNGNPGGGKGNGHWGEGNHGNGRGNIWTGNQGKGVGEGMAGGCRDNGGGGNGGNGGNGGGGNGGNDKEDKDKPNAPLPPLMVPQLGGCPALLNWMAGELQMLEEQIQLYMQSVLAFSPELEPCDAAGGLKDAAAILADAGGGRIEALAQLVNSYADPNAPISAEQMDLIAVAMADIGEDDTYAAAVQWLEALIQYVGILNDEIGLTPEHSIMLASKYVELIKEEGNATVAGYLEVYLQALGG